MTVSVPMLTQMFKQKADAEGGNLMLMGHGRMTAEERIALHDRLNDHTRGTHQQRIDSEYERERASS